MPVQVHVTELLECLIIYILYSCFLNKPVYNCLVKLLKPSVSLHLPCSEKRTSFSTSLREKKSHHQFCLFHVQIHPPLLSCLLSHKKKCLQLSLKTLLLFSTIYYPLIFPVSSLSFIGSFISSTNKCLPTQLNIFL